MKRGGIMGNFSDENRMKKFKNGLESFSELSQGDIKNEKFPINNQESLHTISGEPSFVQSNPVIENDYGYNIPGNQSSQNIMDIPDISTEIPIPSIVPSGKNITSHAEPIINASFFTSKSRSQESEYSENDYIYHDFMGKDGKEILQRSNPLNHDKMAYKGKKTDAGGGATSEYRFTDKGKLKAEVFLAKGKDRTDNKGFRNKTVHFTEEAEEIFDKVKLEDNETLASFSDSKMEAVLIHSSRKHLKKGRRYADIKLAAQKDVSQLKKEIKAEKKAEERAKINSNFNQSNTKFSDDRSSTFSSQVDVKFQTEEKRQRMEALFLNASVSKASVDTNAVRVEVKKNTDKMELFTDNGKKEASSLNQVPEGHAKKESARKVESKFEKRNMTSAEKLEQSKSEKKASNKSEKKEVRKAAAVAAVSKMFDAKKNMQNQLGDMSGQVSGDLMKDGSTGLLQTMTNTFKELILGAARKMAIAAGKAIAPLASSILVPVCIFFLLITIIITVFSAVGGLLGADDGVNYDLDVNGDGYVYTSMSDEQIEEIIEALYDNYSDMSATQEEVIRYSLSKVGCEYNQDYHGNLNVNIFDCSSLAFRAYRDAGIDISNNGAYSAAEECRAMINAGNTITGEMKPGDLIFYGGSDNGRYMGVYHVAIYVGRVDGVDKMVEARGVNYGVVYCDVRANNVVDISRPY